MPDAKESISSCNLLGPRVGSDSRIFSNSPPKPSTILFIYTVLNLSLFSLELSKAAPSSERRKKEGSVESGGGEGEFVGYRVRCFAWLVNAGAVTGLVISADDSESEHESESDSEADESDEESEAESDEDADEELPSTSIASCEAN